MAAKMARIELKSSAKTRPNTRVAQSTINQQYRRLVDIHEQIFGFQQGKKWVSINTQLKHEINLKRMHNQLYEDRGRRNFPYLLKIETLDSKPTQSRNQFSRAEMSMIRASIGAFEVIKS